MIQYFTKLHTFTQKLRHTTTKNTHIDNTTSWVNFTLTKTNWENSSWVNNTSTPIISVKTTNLDYSIYIYFYLVIFVIFLCLISILKH